MKRDIIEAGFATREYRNKLLEDDYRPLYHITNPDGVAAPFDANAGIFYNGRHHMYYIFQDENGNHSFGHFASYDLLHWTCLPDGPCFSEEENIHGMFSGNAFIDNDGKVRIMFCDFGYGNSMLIAEDEDLTKWKRVTYEPMTPADDDCDKWRSWDPCGWVEGGKYYAVYGWFQPALFTSDNGKDFSYAGPFIDRSEAPFEHYEDVSCPDFFKMNGKDVLMHISHARGWQYEIGNFDGITFHPEHHGRMNYPGGQFFAGESYYDDKGRRILMAWVLDAMTTPSVKERGWSGTMSMPRVVTMSEDKTELYCDVPEEFKTLRYCKRDIIGKAPCRKQSEAVIVADANINGNVGIRFTFSENEYVDCLYDGEKKVIRIDSTHGTTRDDVFHPVGPLNIINNSSAEAFKNCGQSMRNQNWTDGITEEMFETGCSDYTEGPLKLAKGEDVTLRAFLDGSILELFANSRQALCVRIYPDSMKNCKVEIIGDKHKIKEATVYDIAPTNMY